MGGTQSATDFAVEVQITGPSELRVTARSQRTLMAVRAENGVAYRVAGMIEQAVKPGR